MVAHEKTQRNFILGDRWIFYKIYTGTNTSDTILVKVIKSVAEKLMANNSIDKWFFIRYADPDFHLRVRFHCTNPESIGLVINSLYSHFKTFINQEIIWKIQTDTYKREIERYGTNTIALAEELFYHDSIMVIDFIRLMENDEREELRWLFSLKAIDSFLDCYMYSNKEKLLLLDRLSTGFGEEFGMSKFLKRQLDDKYREERKKIETFIALKENDNPEYDLMLNILKVRDENIKDIACEILKYKQNGNLQIAIDNLMSSYIHMFMNRLFKSKNRLHEMVCYNFLYRYYKSAIARKKYQKNSLKK